MQRVYLEEKLGGNLIIIFPDQTKRKLKAIDYHYKLTVPHLLQVYYNQRNKLYHIDFEKKRIKQVFKAEGDILYYNDELVFYVKLLPCRYKKTCKGKCKVLACIAKNLHTGEEQIVISTERTYSLVHDGDKYLLLVFYVFNKPVSVAIYDLHQKQVIARFYHFDNFHISTDFLNGETPFYCIKEAGYLTIYNKNVSIGKVRNPVNRLLRRDLCNYDYEPFYVYSVVITSSTQFISDVNNEEGVITFYRLKENGLEPVDALKLNKDYLYESHLASCGSRFVIFEIDKARYKTQFDLENSRNFNRIILYDVNTKKIEYETRYYADTPCLVRDDRKPDFEFIKNLFLYAHNFQDSFFHIHKNEKGKPELMPIEQWQKLQKLKKVAKEITKAFRVPKQEPQPKLVI